MTGWQITAKTIYCDAVEDEVTVMVYKDAPARCTGWKKYTQPNDTTQSAVKDKTRQFKKSIRCEGTQCPRVIQYQEQIKTEETC